MTTAMALLAAAPALANPAVGSSLDPTDRLILTVERRAPGPHHDDLGISTADYQARLRRLLYDRDANEYAPSTLARLRVELLAGDAETRY